MGKEIFCKQICLIFSYFLLNKILLLVMLRNVGAVKVTLLDKLTIEFGLQRRAAVLGQRGDSRSLAKLNLVHNEDDDVLKTTHSGFQKCKRSFLSWRHNFYIPLQHLSQVLCQSHCLLSQAITVLQMMKGKHYIMHPSEYL